MIAILAQKSSAFPSALSLLLVLSLVLSGCAGQPGSAGAGEYTGTVLNSPASDFHLIDQSGTPISLSDFTGQVVVLAFMDSQCKEVCPLTAVHLREANRMLGDQSTSVVFIGLNVNLEANRVADALAATEKWWLDEIPTWHFLTGSAEELEPVWESYDVAVVPAPEEQEELLHTPGVYLIDQSGEKRWYISTPFDESGTPAWTAPLSELLVERIRELLEER